MNKNVLLMTDVYKLGHMEQYPEGTTKVYSYLMARNGKSIPRTVFFGLQYYLQEYLQKQITHEMVDEFLVIYKYILGRGPSDKVVKQIRGLADLGYWPLKIKAVPEGTVMPTGNVLMTVENTHPDFAWTVGFVESLLLKVWNTTTVASYSLQIRQLVEAMAVATCDDFSFLDYQVHDFGYRGCSSEETAALSGAAHLIAFRGTDTIPAIKLISDHYYAHGYGIGSSVPASEHSVMCAFGRENELEAFKNMLKVYPTGIVSIVSDTYNLWNVLTTFASDLKEQILARDGKVVFRPDSGNPVNIICGDPDAEEGTLERKGAIELLWDMFGGTTNSRGYKVLNPKVGLIYGDGMTMDNMKLILGRLAAAGFASSNIVFGIGGLLLQSRSRDEMGFAFKATYCEVNGEGRHIKKDPITDTSKRSHTGKMILERNMDAKEGTVTYRTVDGLTTDHGGFLGTVFENGYKSTSIEFWEVRNNLKESLCLLP